MLTEVEECGKMLLTKDGWLKISKFFLLLIIVNYIMIKKMLKAAGC